MVRGEVEIILVEENGSVWKCVEVRKEFWLVEEGRKLKEKEKRKRNYNEKIFSWERR